jgi:hypothetical protein
MMKRMMYQSTDQRSVPWLLAFLMLYLPSGQRGRRVCLGVIFWRVESNELYRRNRMWLYVYYIAVLVCWVALVVYE